MKIAVNLRTYVKGQIGGMENYVREIAGGLAARETVTAFVHREQMDNVREFLPTAELIPVIHETAQHTLEQALESGGFDVLFCPLLVLDPLKPGVPAAVTIPDIQHEFLPEFFDSNTLLWRRQHYRPSTIHARHVFTISEHSRQTIVDRFRVSPEKVEVVYLDAGAEYHQLSAATGEASEAFRQLGLPGRYVFYPANFWPHKNHATLLRAFQSLRSTHPDLGLVLTGSAKGAESVRAEIDRLGLAGHVHVPGYLDRQLLADVCRRAAAMAFVSKFEGFGIPILEAFHAGVPVVASRIGACVEVGGEAAVYVDPESAEQMAAALDSLLRDSEMREALLAKGRDRARFFSWRKALDQTQASLRRIADPAWRAPHYVLVDQHPMVTVVTPSFNQGRFIRETIDSVLTQDYPHIDYIVMDGASTDETVDVLKSYGRRFRWESKKDKGQADAINQGFQVSRGQIFTFLNADDTYLPGAVSTAVRRLLENPTAGVVYGEANYVREDGSLIGRYPTLPFDMETLNRTCFICQPAAFMWSDVFHTSGCLNPDLHYALDYDLWIRIAKLYPFLKVEDVLATSRMYRDNKTLGQRRRVFMEILSTAKEHFQYVPFDWVYGYSAYLVDRKDGFFDPSPPSLPKVALSFALGSYYNRGALRRYWHDWARQVGLSSSFLGRYDDGWIARRWVTSRRVEAPTLRLEGRHIGPFPRGLALTVKLQGRELARRTLTQQGPFCWTIPLPPELHGRDCRFEIEASRTFRPIGTGDYRRLSVIIDTLRFDEDSAVAS